jgi:hypothetical protein
MTTTRLVKIVLKHMSENVTGKQYEEIIKDYRNDFPGKEEYPEHVFFFSWYYIKHMMPEDLPILFIELPCNKKDLFNGFQINNSTMSDDSKTSFWAICPRLQNGETTHFVDCKNKRFATALEKQLTAYLQAMPSASRKATGKSFSFTGEELVKALALSLHAFKIKK